ncbi:MAG: ABC transporter ATP-binding protein [Smithellaceae bacterium]|jgi:lipoprotein-releasing system ATP-binding protein|nr:ABC transporter ATP-binding protein [Smithellaceae bacterium]MDD3259951.1 ABC transporter ATP-binding protein [Smithellaceae bacterium]MDD3847969.1 ABC transporter ATP-binding protein [Smithellaceae bacterium]HOQ71656.1 ABC transporter ATP-binding protein [Smithellaceae bacterium]HPL10299.1 ABC transporter ATP-binding protein [Smithellaceae bacterium]
MIRLENLSKTFVKDGNKIEVLKGLNLEIARGDSLAVVGVSGAGKSTLIHILGTLDHPTEGLLSIAGQAVFDWNERKIAAFRNRTIGFVFQFNNLLPEFTALENAMMPALIGGLNKKEANDRAARLLTEVGLEHRLQHKPGELSGGEQQRVAIARALVMEPEILLADEPTGNLDTETGKKIEDILIDLNAEKKITLVVVTHNRLLAERMSGRIGLRDGKIYDF